MGLSYLKRLKDPLADIDTYELYKYMFNAETWGSDSKYK